MIKVLRAVIPAWIVICTQFLRRTGLAVRSILVRKPAWLHTADYIIFLAACCKYKKEFGECECMRK